MNRKSKGKKGELLAKLYYEHLGYEILEQNYRYKRGEIDLIALKDNELLVFIEVKFRSSSQFGESETFVTPNQQNLIKEVAEEYIFAINWQKDIRFDIVCFDKNYEITVFSDAF